MQIGPYETGRVYQGDCLELMKALPSGVIEAIVTDPPYGIGMDGGNVGYKGFNDFAKKAWDKQPPPKSHFAEMFRVSLAQIIWGGNYFALPPSRMWLVWDKGAGFRGRTYAEAELAWTSMDGNVRVFQRDPLCTGDYRGKLHPAMKPLPLMRWCVEKVDGEGIILDPYCGSGTTGVACVELERPFLGFEVDPEFCQLANDRIEAARHCLGVKEYRAGQKGLF